MGRNSSFLLGGALIVLVAAVAFMQTRPSSPTIAAPDAAHDTEPHEHYSVEEVAQHNSQASCWVSIDGGVYDVTGWIAQHPGGPQAIMSLCGTDGTAAFRGQHGTSGRPAAALASFKIGELAH